MIEMISDQGEQLSKEVTIPAMGRLQDTFQWKPGSVGNVKLLLKVPVADEERNEKNNQLSAPSRDSQRGTQSAPD